MSDDRPKVAIAVWNDAELLDFAGPGEVFAAADSGKAFNVYTVGPNRSAVLSQGFVTIMPEYGVASAPIPDVLILPGGGAEAILTNSTVIDWIRRSSVKASCVLSVCTGALLLAHAGLLDGLQATTWHGAMDRLRAAAPRTRVVEGARWIDNGRIITSAGVSAGIDAALHVVARLKGMDTAVATARYMEYTWVRPESEQVV